MAGGISVHGVDVTRGAPAHGMAVEIYALDPARRLIAEGQLAASGALDHPIAQGAAAGAYEVVFHAGALTIGHVPKNTANWAWCTTIIAP